MSKPRPSARTLGSLLFIIAAGCAPPEDIEVQGRLQRVVMDSPERGESRVVLMLESAGGGERELVFADPHPPELPTGALVRARGHLLPPLPWNNTARFAVRSFEIWSPAGDPSAQARAVIIDPARAPAKRKLAVVLFNFQNDDRQPLTPDELRKRIFTNPNSTRAFHREQSYGFVDLVGKANPDGDVFGWYTIPAFNRPCNHGAWGEAALAAAAAQGLDTSGYDHYVFFFPQTDACYYSGIGQQPGRNTWMNGLSIATMNHELGHNLGTPHAASRSCTGPGGERVTLSSSCRDSEYGNPFDVMGGGVRHTNALNKAQARWLSGGNVQYVTNDGTYTLLPQERPSNGVQLLTTVRDEISHYYLEYRQPFGFDDFPADSPAVNGVMVLVGGTLRQLGRSYLLDMNPATSTFGDAPLAVGKTFADPGGEVKITVVELTPEAARVKFEFRGGSNMSVPDGGRQDAAAADRATATPDTGPDRTADLAGEGRPADGQPEVGQPADAGALDGARAVVPRGGAAGSSCQLAASPGGGGFWLVALGILVALVRKKRRARAASGLALLALVLGCSSNGGPSPRPRDAALAVDATADAPADRPGPDRDDEGDLVTTDDDGGTSSGRIFLYPVSAEVEVVCGQYAATYCARLAECVPRRLAIDHGNQELCRARRDQACRTDFLAPSRAERPEDRTACTRATAAQTCRDFYFARRLPACDAPPGTLALGAVCFRTSQCAAGLACRVETDETCGTCQRELAVGGDCSVWSGGCPVGTRCYGDECLARRKLGEACKMTSAPCEPGLECTARGCVEKEAATGAACAREDVCDPMKDVYCNLKTGLCEPLPPPVARGGKCGNTTAGGAFLRCGDDAVCFGPSDDPLNRTCVGRAALGSPCDSVKGVSCTAPGACVQKTCTVPTIVRGGRYTPTACQR